MTQLKIQWEKISLGTRVGLAFALVTLLVVIVILTGMIQMRSINKRVSQFIYTDSHKVELVHRMIDALHTRTASMQSLSNERDPFIQDDAFIKLVAAGDKFIEARNDLVAMKLSADENNILEQVRELAARVRPEMTELIDESIKGRQDVAYSRVMQEIMPKQRMIVGFLDELLIIQQDNAYRAEKSAKMAYDSAWLVMSILCAVAAMFGIIIIIAVVRLTNRQASLLSYQALYDSLTGLPNRSLFGDRLLQTSLTFKRTGGSFALITMDLNQFKEINDSLGHQAGDEVLIQVARRCQQCLRASDTVARIGGDEFTIMLPSTKTAANASIAAKKLIEKIKAPMLIRGREIEVSASLGVAIFPDHADTIERLQRLADSAMYQAKREHTGYAIYNEEMREAVSDSLSLQTELRKAIAEGQLILHYQPKIEFATSRISGVEALVRWQHPERGLVMPDEFIPVAENSELIRPLTEYVLRMATRQASQWLKSGTRLSVAVNVSAVNIQDPMFADQVKEILKQADLPAELLELELTESAVMSKPELAIQCIKQLHEAGIHVSIDDFGTGYTSMSQLKGLLVTKIKIDRSFVTNMLVSHSDAVIVRTTVDLSHNLGFKVVAEGVENQETWDRLESLGCDSAQGYHMGKPLSPDMFDKWYIESPWGKNDDT